MRREPTLFAGVEWPRWRLRFPTLPTISGKRHASRRMRWQWLRGLKSDADARWVRRAAHYAMTQQQRLDSASSEEQRRIVEEGL